MAEPSHRHRPAASGNPWVRRGLIAAALVLTLLFMIAPILVVFLSAFAKGFEAYWTSITHPETLHAIWLTVLVAVAVVPFNLAFGLCAAWAIAKFSFPGKKILLSLIEVPFSVSPIVAGVAYLMVYGSQGLLGEWLEALDIRVMFAIPGIILVTMFVTSPFVAREVIPLMQAQGNDEEEAALSLGANFWQTFLRVTLPNIKWALLYGVILCTARSVGEFGAVSVVSGHVRGETNTLPLQIDLLYHDYDAAGAFAAASVLTILALMTLGLKAWVEHREEAPRPSSGH